MLGRIYIIQSPYTDEVYIGSTIQTLHKRFWKHKSRGNSSSSYLVIDEGDATIELLEEVKVVDERELAFYENQYLELYRDIAVNEKDAFCGANKNERDKKYYEKNKEIIIEKRKKYYEKKKEKLGEKFECLCGGHYRYDSKAQHLKTQKHKNYVATL